MTTTPAPLLEAARTAAVTAARHAAHADTEGGVPVETVDALVEAGFCRCFVPEAWGGAPVGFAGLTDAVAAVGESCASSAWLASLFAYTSRFAAYLPPSGQKAVWGNGPDTRLVCAVAPSGSAVPDAGGWRISGRWDYASGVAFADWALLVGPSPAQDDMPTRFFAVPRGSYTIEETWSATGMRATASDTVVLDDVLVPEDHTFLRADVSAGRDPGHGAAIYRAPMFSVNGLTFGAPVLGAARGALAAAEVFLADQRGLRAATGDFRRVAYARAAGTVDAAELLLRRAAETADTGNVTDDLLARGYRDTTLAVEMLVDAVDGLVRIGGTRALGRSHPLERAWRDAHTAASHAVMQFEQAALSYVQQRFATD